MWFCFLIGVIFYLITEHTLLFWLVLLPLSIILLIRFIIWLKKWRADRYTAANIKKPLFPVANSCILFSSATDIMQEWIFRLAPKATFRRCIPRQILEMFLRLLRRPWRSLLFSYLLLWTFFIPPISYKVLVIQKFRFRGLAMQGRRWLPLALAPIPRRYIRLRLCILRISYCFPPLLVYLFYTAMRG